MMRYTAFMRLYLDACCLGRLTDNQKQARVREEAGAVEHILRAVSDGRVAWVSSVVLEIEVDRNPNDERRGDTAAVLAYANERVIPGPDDELRAQYLQTLGFSPFDALHLACAESSGVDVFLTTDDGLLRRAHRFVHLLRVRVENPVSWYQEVLQ